MPTISSLYSFTSHLASRRALVEKSCVMTNRHQLLKVQTPDGKEMRNAEWPRLAKCYALGGFLQDIDFKDAAIDAMIEALIVWKRVPVNIASYL
jgi:hypothetical protein